MKPSDFLRALVDRGLEERPAQAQMLKLVEKALKEGKTLLVEAPPGTGKTFAYLIPIIALKKKAVVSTGTKLLQDQLKRDLGFLIDHWKKLNRKPPTFCVIKGKANYLCLDRFDKEDIPPEERQKLEDLIRSGWDGDLTLSDVPKELSGKLSVDDDYCTPAYRKLCPRSGECYYWARLKEKERRSDILIVNHSLLALKDLSQTKRALIVDEAHELDRYLTLASTLRVSLSHLNDIKNQAVKLLRKDIPLNPEELFNPFRAKLPEEGEIPLTDTKEISRIFYEKVIRPLRGVLNEIKEKLREEVRSYVSQNLIVSKTFKDFLLTTFLLRSDELESLRVGYKEMSAGERSLAERIKKHDTLTRKLRKLKLLRELLEEEPKDTGFKISRTRSPKLGKENWSLEAFPVFPRGLIRAEDFCALVLTSATVEPQDIYLTTGISGEYHVLGRGYDYAKSTLIVQDTNPKREDWREKLEMSFYTLRARYGKVLVLLTNKEHLKIFEGDPRVGLQGNGSLTLLLEKLRRGEIDALVGLDSLWTGVDVKGKKGILISKLPFECPTEPLTYYRLKRLKEEGEDPFLYQRRKALVKFRQGIGRLVRSREDFGTVILCDNRIWRYPEFIDFLKSLGINLISKGRFKKKALRIW
ncbi:MAG: ATP-dependent DNA helicase [Aquificae bacterium]|nr:ATP-dependent DNA helicase [Aquificota bacterium]